MNDERLIFISNDDGYSALGIKKLIEIACDYGKVIAIAPMHHQSGKSSAITIDVPLFKHVIEQTDRYTIIGVTGTPTDCAKLAFNKLLPRKPDLVLSGINHGYNAGNSVIYSGTMGVVFEGLFQNIPSIGFSYSELSPKADFTPCDEPIRHILDRFFAGDLPVGVGLNVNIPKTEGRIKGYRITKSSCGKWIEEYDQRVDPFGREYYWLTGHFVNEDACNPQGDLYWLDRGYVSITPCHTDQTDYNHTANLKLQFE